MPTLFFSINIPLSQEDTDPIAYYILPKTRAIVFNNIVLTILFLIFLVTILPVPELKYLTGARSGQSSEDNTK